MIIQYLIILIVFFYIKIFKIKISLDEIKSSQPNKSIIELGSSGFAANESVNNAFEHSNTGIHKYFNSIN